MSDESFLAELEIPELSDRYAKERDEIRSSISRRFREEREHRLRDKLKGIKEDQAHRRILNACIFPFTLKGRMPGLGYSFVRASPLAEKEVSNLDFLIYNPSNGMSIFGEAKGSVADPGAVVDQIEDRQREVANYSDYIISDYLRGGGFASEFVLGVGWMDALEVGKSVLRKGASIVVWQVGRDMENQEARLSIAIPPRQPDDSHVPMRHRDDSFNRALVKVDTSFECKTFFLQSHSVWKMLVLVHVDKGKEDGLFEFDDLLSLVRQELDYLPEEIVRDEARKILKIGIAVGFVEIEGSKYLIGSRSKRASVREKELRDSWIKWSVENDEDREISAKLKPIREKYLEEKKKFTKITDFQ